MSTSLALTKLHHKIQGIIPCYVGMQSKSRDGAKALKFLCTKCCGGMWLKLKLAGKEFGGLSLLFVASGRS